jgi:hypothetical protein
MSIGTMLYKRLSSKRDSRKDLLLIKHSHKVHTQKAHAVMLLSLCALPEHFAKHDVGMQTKYSFLKKFLLSLGISFKHILHNSCFRLAFTRIKYGNKQTLDTLISEEALLLAKFLRNERKEWKPRIALLV